MFHRTYILFYFILFNFIYFLLFYFIADVHTCAINTEVYLIVVSGVTTDRTDPAIWRPPARGTHAQHAEFLLTSNAYLFPLLFYSLSILDICFYLLKESIKRHVTLTLLGYLVRGRAGGPWTLVCGVGTTI